MAVITDISGTPIPASSANTAAGVNRVLAIPPVRDVPNEQAIEFLLSAFGELVAGGTTFLPLTDPTTGNPFAGLVDPQYRGRIDSMLVYCPDMVADTAPYLFASLTVAGQLANAWGFIPVYPRSGVASLTFPTVIDLPPGTQIGILGKNTDAANNHFLAVYLHGWYWPKDIVEG